MRKFTAYALGACLLAGLAGVAPAQEGGERPERGQRGERPERGERGERPERGERGERPERGERGNFDPAQMQQRMMERMRDQLGATEEEWTVLQPKLEAVT